MEKAYFQQKILQWYTENKRDLPWRRTTDPYKIMVSEIMLQQTQVERVIPKYLAFIERFPTVKDLAQASPGEVLALWSGLGYNGRALRLQKAAKIIYERYEGIIPHSREQLLTLPGIGPYTANALLSFAFNLPYPCIDTNIRRILLHELHLPEHTSIDALYTIAQTLIPEGKSREWHNALMDYGNVVLTSKKTGIKPLTTQSKFLHSRRWYRGQIMKLLVQHKTVTLGHLCKTFQKEKEWLAGLLEEMAEEGLVCFTQETVTLPQ